MKTIAALFLVLLAACSGPSSQAEDVSSSTSDLSARALPAPAGPVTFEEQCSTILQIAGSPNSFAAEHTFAGKSTTDLLVHVRAIRAIDSSESLAAIGYTQSTARGILYAKPGGTVGVMCSPSDVVTFVYDGTL